MITVNTICHTMPTTPKEIEMNYLHTCSDGPILGRYLTVSRVEKEVMSLSELVVWNEAQPEDFSDYHGNTNG